MKTLPHRLPRGDRSRRRRPHHHRRRRAARRRDRADRRRRARRARQRADAARPAVRARSRGGGAAPQRAPVPARLNVCTNPLKARFVRADTRDMLLLIGIASVWIFSCLMAVALCVMARRGDDAMAAAMATVARSRAEVASSPRSPSPTTATPARTPAPQRSASRPGAARSTTSNSSTRRPVGHGALCESARACACPRVKAADLTQFWKSSSRVPVGDDEVAVLALDGAQQLEAAEAGHPVDLGGALGEARLELGAAALGDLDGVDLDDHCHRGLSGVSGRRGRRWRARRAGPRCGR